MLLACFDEAGTGSAEELCVVAGFVGNEAQWSSFAADWIPALGKHRQNLHMRKLRWKQRYDKIASDLRRLGPIPHKYNLSPVSVGMRHQDFIDLMQGKVREKFANPYITCAQIAMATVLAEIADPDEEVMFIFDQQEGRRAEAMHTLREIVFRFAKMDKRLKDIDFRSHKTTVFLDPADYLAFAVREGDVHPMSPKAKASSPILAQPMYGGILTRDQVKSMADTYIAHGMVPGGGPVKMSKQLAAALLKAGWSESSVNQFAATVLSGRLPPEKEIA